MKKELKFNKKNISGPNFILNKRYLIVLYLVLKKKANNCLGSKKNIFEFKND